MIFRSKIDKFFINLLLIIVLSIGGLAFLPFYFNGIKNNITPNLISMMILFLTIGFMLWTSFSIKYVFNEDFLLVKGGPIKSRIRYENITNVSPTTDVFTGYRILSSRDALEIFYKNALLGSVKISPENQKAFVDELKRRCPNLHIK